MEMDGIVTFFSLFQALRAERAVKNAGIAGRLVPAPRDLSPTCVTALRFAWPEAERVGGLLEAQRIEFEQCLLHPEAEHRPAGWAAQR